jgi:hypothetical protein
MITMRVIYPSKRMSEKFGVRVIHRCALSAGKYGNCYSVMVYLMTPSHTTWCAVIISDQCPENVWKESVVVWFEVPSRRWGEGIGEDAESVAGLGAEFWTTECESFDAKCCHFVRYGTASRRRQTNILVLAVKLTNTFDLGGPPLFSLHFFSVYLCGRREPRLSHFSLRGSLYSNPCFSSPIHLQRRTTSERRERLLLAKGGIMGEKWPVKFSRTTRLPRNCWDLLHAANLRHGTDGFTSPPKEGMLWIFSPEKIRRLRPGSNPAEPGTRGQHTNH